MKLKSKCTHLVKVWYIVQEFVKVTIILSLSLTKFHITKTYPATN